MDDVELLLLIIVHAKIKDNIYIAM